MSVGGDPPVPIDYWSRPGDLGFPHLGERVAVPGHCGYLHYRNHQSLPVCLHSRFSALIGRLDDVDDYVRSRERNLGVVNVVD